MGHLLEKCPKERAGFTLLELMVTVSIIGILSILAVQEYDLFMAKSKRMSAISTLNGVITAQKVYFAEESRFATSFSELSFEMERSSNLGSNLITGNLYQHRLFGSSGWWFAISIGNIDPDTNTDVLAVIHNIYGCTIYDGIRTIIDDIANYSIGGIQKACAKPLPATSSDPSSGSIETKPPITIKVKPTPASVTPKPLKKKKTSVRRRTSAR